MVGKGYGHLICNELNFLLYRCLARNRSLFVGPGVIVRWSCCFGLMVSFRGMYEVFIKGF